MNEDDAQRWNKRYKEEERYNTFSSPRPFLVEFMHLLPAGGLALDAAMGLGGNAGLLLQHGWRVIGVDISYVAVERAKNRLPDLMAVVADLTSFSFPHQRFDLILNFYYLNRKLWPNYEEALQPGGVLVFETMTAKMLVHQPEIPRAYVLEEGELRDAFPRLQILHYSEENNTGRSGRPRPVARLIAQKVGSF